MDDLLEYLKRLDARFDELEFLIRSNDTNGAAKKYYSCAEVANLTAKKGIQKYATFTIRLACSDGRIPEAEKNSSGIWRIPTGAVTRILNDGVPPERRDQK